MLRLRRGARRVALAIALLSAALALTGDPALAAVSVTSATGGTGISAGTASGAFSTLSGPTLAEGSSGEISAGSVIIDTPAGFAFRTTQPVTINDTGAGDGIGSIRISPSSDCSTPASTISVTPTATQISFWVCAVSADTSHLASLTFSALAVRPTAGSPLAAGDLLIDPASTATIAGATKGSAGTSLGTLTDGAGATTQLVVSALTSPLIAGTASTVVVKTADQFGNQTDQGYTGTIHFTSSDAQAVLPSDYAFVATDHGSRTFPAGVMLKTAGSQSVTATDTVTTALQGSRTVAVNPATTSVFAVSGIPSPVTAGTAANVTVTAKDAFDNTVTDFAGTVHLASSDVQAVLPPDATLNGGSQTLSVTLKTAGTQSVSATDSAVWTTTGLQSGITVQPAATATLHLAASPATVVAGDLSHVTVTATDGFGNTATGYGGTVHFSSTDAQAVLPSDSTLTNGSNTFDVGLKTVASQTITATDTTTGSIAGSTTVAVTAGATTHFSVSAPPSTAAGTAASVTVTALDAFGNTAPAYAGTVHIATGDPQATMPGDTTLTGGTGTFALTLKTAGAQTITATDVSDGSITGHTTLAVDPAPVSKFSVATVTPVSAGASFSVTVTAQDQFGNTVPSYAGTVHLTSTDPHAVLPPDSTLIPGTGVGAFTVTLETAGVMSITANDVWLIGTAAGITVNPGPAAKINVTGIPTPIPAHLATNATVTVVDAFGNVVTGYAGTTHFTSSDPLASLPADATFTSGTHVFVNGVVFHTGGTQSVAVTDASTPALTGTESGITVTTTGSLTLNESTQSITLPAMTLNGLPQFVSGDLAVIQVQNGRNIADGWTVSATMSDLTADGSTAANHIVPASDVAIDPAAHGGCHPYDANGDGLPDGLQQGVSAGPGGLFSTSAHPVTLSTTTPVSLCWGADGFGQGAFEDQPAIQVRIAPSKAAGTYTGTLTIIAA